MNNKNYWEKTRYIPKTSFDSYLAKDKKKDYNQNSVVNNPTTYSAFTKSYQKNKNAFDNDAVANSALDYLYSSNNRGKTQSFLENNGFPSYEDREYNKEYYGVQEENNRMRDLLKTKTNSILNPKLPDKTDRLFLSGFLGDEEEEQNYQNEIANVNRAREELQNAFRGSIFESALNGNFTPTIQKINSTPQISHAILRDLDAKNKVKPIGTYDPNKEPVITQYSNNKEPTMWFENGEYAAAQQKTTDKEYNKKVAENAEMNGKSVWKTRKASDVIVENAEFIKSAAKRHGVNPAILAACIYTEQANNVTITEDLEDYVQKELGMSCSVGVSQVRTSTAKRIEEEGYMPKTYDSETRNNAFQNPFTGKSIYSSDTYSRDEEIYYKLKDPETNINYAAACLAMLQDRWREEYPIIAGDSAILATLYNNDEDGKKMPHPNPKPSPFGDFAKANYSYMQYLLGIE